MKVAALQLAALLVALPSAFHAVQVARTGFDQSLGSIADVITTLEGILTDSQTAGKNENEAYATLRCDCDKDIDAKTTSIKDLTAEIAQSENKIEELQGSTGELSSDVAALKDAMAKNTQKQSDLEAVRNNEKKDYDALKLDLDAAIEQLRKATEELAAINADQTLGNAAADHTKFMGGFKSSLVSKKKATVKKALLSAESLLPPKQQRHIEALIQKAPFTGSYTSQSAEVIGILKNMKDTFEQNLATATEAEKKAKEAYDKVIATLKSEFSTMEGLYNDKQGLLSGNDDALGSKKTQLSTAKQSLDADQSSLATIRAGCADGEAHYEARKIYRANEDVALSQAIAILKGESSTFGKVQATSFLQVSAGKHQSAADAEWRQSAEAALRGIAVNGHAAKQVLILLEAGNPFTVVLAKIQEMIKVIDDEAEVDKTQKEWCEKERQLNNAAKDAKGNSITSLEGQISLLDEKIDHEQTGFKVSIKGKEADLEGVLKAMKDQTKIRADENKLYQESVRTLVKAEETITKAIKVLQAYYVDYYSKVVSKPIKQQTGKDFGNYKSQKTAGEGVISTLQTIFTATKEEEDKAHLDERKEQHDYEDAMQGLKTDESTMEEDIAKLKQLLAEAEQEREQAYEDKYNTEKDKMAIENYLKDIKIGCDFAIDKYADREAARTKEKAALNFAKTKLEGSPAFAAAELKDKHDAQGVCKETCVEDEVHVNCKACLAKVSVPGYCAGHPGTKGC